jgi:glycosyltransferase involved in cell wall biosynthesis
MKILVIAPHPIFQMGYMNSQVNGQFAFLASLGWDVTLLSAGDPSDARVAAFSQGVENKGMQCRLIPPTSSPLRRCTTGVRIAAAIIRKERPAAIYTREVWGSIIANWACKLAGVHGVRIVYDVRGAVPEEIGHHAKGFKNKAKQWLFTLLERFAITHATRTNAVTDALSEHMAAKYGRRADTRIPCCLPGLPVFSGSLRQSMRRSLGFPELAAVYVYSGGVSKWQMFDQMVSVFRKIHLKDADARLLVLTPDLEKAAAVLSGQLPDCSYVLKSVKQDDVLSHLVAGDVGFLLREESIVNQVAFPIKFGEYLAAGLSVITSPGLTEIAGIISKEELGLVVNPLVDEVTPILEWVNNLKDKREACSDRCRSYAQRKLLWSSYLSDFEKLYGDSPDAGCA